MAHIDEAWVKFNISEDLSAITGHMQVTTVGVVDKIMLSINLGDEPKYFTCVIPKSEGITDICFNLGKF